MGKNNPLKILVTGANGFIGRNLCAYLKEKGYCVLGAVRNNARDVPGVDEYILVGDINESTDWQEALDGVDTVIHLAGRVHIKSDCHALRDSHFLFHKVNVLGTKRLAEQAAQSGVRRFIFISSVKVNGEDAYGVSKLEAEQVLASIAKETGFEVVILRLPLVYGVGVKANFKNLIKLVRSGLPLPFKGVNNRRSFLYVGNLVDAIAFCIQHLKAAGETFLLSDGQDVSTPDLIKMIARAMKTTNQVKTRGRFCFFGKSIGKNRTVPCLFYLHPGILKALCKIIGRAEELEKLTGTLLVDSSKIRNLLGWKPPWTLEEGIMRTVKGV